jgi:hypothetical protein
MSKVKKDDVNLIGSIKELRESVEKLKQKRTPTFFTRKGKSKRKK